MNYPITSQVIIEYMWLVQFQPKFMSYRKIATQMFTKYQSTL